MIESQESAPAVIAVIDNYTARDSGKVFGHTGKLMPWYESARRLEKGSKEVAGESEVTHHLHGIEGFGQRAWCRRIRELWLQPLADCHVQTVRAAHHEVEQRPFAELELIGLVVGRPAVLLRADCG
jgi:hypothetical protein